MSLITYLLAAMLFWSPLHEYINHEDPAKRLERYRSIASDIAEVVMDPNEKPVFQDKWGREKTGLLLASIAWHESGFHEDVDNGTRRGDDGRSVCIMQVMTNTRGTTYSHTADYLLKDRKNCIRAALLIARYKCKGGINSRLRAYASGSCKKRSNPKHERSVTRAAKGLVNGYVRWFYSFPPRKYIKKS